MTIKVENNENKLVGYDGRCADFAGSIVSKMLSFGRGDVALNPETGKRELWEMQLPIPRVGSLEELAEDCMDLYNLTLEQFSGMAVELLSTRIDDQFKKSLFAFVPAVKVDGKIVEEAYFERACYEPIEAVHRTAQAVADEWRYSPRTAKVAGTPFDEIKRQLVDSGAVTAEDLADCKTDRECFAVMKAKLAAMSG